MTTKPVDLDALTNPARQGAVSVAGVPYPVSPLSHGAVHRIAVATEGKSNAEVVAAMQAGAREAVPTMPDDVFARLTFEQVSAVVGIARAGADEVEKLIAEHTAGKVP